MFRQRLTIDTRGRGTHEITRQVQQIVERSGVNEGLCHVFIHHTSASLIVCENADPTVRRDLESYAARLAPDGDPSYVHDSEGPDDMSAHIRSILTLTSLTIPVQRGPVRPWHMAGDLPVGASDEPPSAADHRHRRGRDARWRLNARRQSETIRIGRPIDRGESRRSADVERAGSHRRMSRAQ